jgi:hypothetical protein
MSDARGDLPMPAIGRISGQYGETMETGISRKGIDIETRAGAQVVAPFDGKVVFAVCRLSERMSADLPKCRAANFMRVGCKPEH